MCGICGSLGLGTATERLHAATGTMFHRGPNEAGYYCAEGVALGMRRLSIIDLAGGTQPKTDESGRIQVVFNGEIYNYRELQDELRGYGHTFASHSDTEVIAHAYEEWGTDAFRRFNGIFATAIWERDRRRLTIARDHFGIKPLFYTSRGGRLAFGSELKPLLALWGEVPPIDPVSAMLFLRYQYVPAPRTIFSGVYKLPAAHFLVCREGSEPEIRPYWDPLQVAQRKRTDITVDEARDLVDETVRRAVRRQMVSDVPLGAFLSGGVDSSMVVAMMQGAGGGRTKTFSIGFEEARVDESVYARAVAEHLDTEHHGWTITDQEARDVVPKLPHFFDEPFADPSAIPTYLVSQLAKQRVTVSLSGDGGDELFGGYEIHGRLRRAKHWWQVPASARRAALPLARVIPGSLGTDIRNGLDILAQPTQSEAYRNMMAVTRDATLERLMRDPAGARTANPEWPAHVFAGRNLDEAMMLTDLLTYLPDDVLQKVDRASMAHSLEARVPVLDVELVECALTLPTAIRLHGGPKALFRDVLKRYVPAALVDRPKQGFAIPLKEWLRGGLREYLTDYTTAAALDRHGLLDTGAVQRMVWEHLEHTADWSQPLWAVLMLQMWHAEMQADLAGAGVPG